MTSLFEIRSLDLLDLELVVHASGSVKLCCCTWFWGAVYLGRGYLLMNFSPDHSERRELYIKVSVTVHMFSARMELHTIRAQFANFGRLGSASS
jgi:hypothetical protein